MMDRSIHIVNKFSTIDLSKEVVEKAVTQYSEKGMPTAIHFLVSDKGMNPSDAGILMKKIEEECIKINKELLAFKCVFLVLFVVILYFAIKAQSPFFIVVGTLLTLRRTFSIIRFIKNNSFTPNPSL